MSGRSAHVRKKITLIDKADGKLPAKSPQPTVEENVATHEYPIASHRPDLVGYGTTNGRFLKFSEPMREPEPVSYAGPSSSATRPPVGDAQSTGSSEGRRESNAHFSRPLDDFAYGRARKPTIKTEEVSAIEKSGLRNILDKKSDEVRKGLAKTFTFSRKNKDLKVDQTPDFRPQSSATVRPRQFPPVNAGASNGSDRDAGETGYDSNLDLPASNYTHSSNSNSNRSVAPSADPSPWESGAGASSSGGGAGLMSPPPSTKLPAVPAGAAPPIQRWMGAGRPVQRWNKLRKDPELWDPVGDVLVFYGHKGQSPRPHPSFRLSSHIIEATESRFLITLLREGWNDDDFSIAPSPMTGGASGLQRYPSSQRLDGEQGQQQRHLGSRHIYGPQGQLTPPASEDASLGVADGQISYEMYFPTPANLNRVDQLRHHITTRNVFALLYHASLVGMSLYQTLSDLHGRLETYLPHETDPVVAIVYYMSARGLDDVRNDPEVAASLLAWAEDPEVRWDEGWRESFMHCAGMFHRLENTADYKHITPITRAMLERASLETQLRVQAAEDRLAEFQYADMWPSSVATAASTSGPVTVSPAKATADRLQRFLIAHYTRIYGRWPPLPANAAQSWQHGSHGGGRDVPIGTALGGAEGGEEELWLTRTIAQELQRDFGALYDYLVDREVRWDGSETRAGRKWMMISDATDRPFAADTVDLPMTDILIEFDNKMRYPHIPHPYPLVPESVPPPPTQEKGALATTNDRKQILKKATSGSGASGASSPAPGSLAGGGQSRSNAQERRIQLAYTEATNLTSLGSTFMHSDLIEAFGKFEKSDRIGELDPYMARRARWVLIYGVLQTLGSVSVDAPNLRYTDGVAYHLSPRLKGARMPPWRTLPPSPSEPEEASHELSHCWLATRRWNGDMSAGGMTGGSNTATNSGADSSAASSGGSGETSPVAKGYGFYPKLHKGARAPPSIAGSQQSYGVASSVAGSSVYGRGSVSASSTAPTSRYASGVPWSSAGSVMSESEASMMRAPPPSSRRQKPRDHAREYRSGSSAADRGAGVLDEDDAQSFITSLSRPDPAILGMGRGGRDSGRSSGFGRALLSGGDSETDSVAPVIRDFDELDIIDDHEP